VVADTLKSRKSLLQRTFGREGGCRRGSSVEPAKKSTSGLCFDAKKVEEVATALKRLNDPPLACIWTRQQGGGGGKERVTRRWSVNG